MKLNERIEIAATLLVVALLIGGTFFWWLPQKWTACGKLYGNLPARIICFSSGN
jgi:hypothetical protein